jgi:hypothetical protein
MLRFTLVIPDRWQALDGILRKPIIKLLWTIGSADYASARQKC